MPRRAPGSRVVGGGLREVAEALVQGSCEGRGGCSSGKVWARGRAGNPEGPPRKWGVPDDRAAAGLAGVLPVGEVQHGGGAGGEDQRSDQEQALLAVAPAVSARGPVRGRGVSEHCEGHGLAHVKCCTVYRVISFV